MYLGKTSPESLQVHSERPVDNKTSNGLNNNKIRVDELQPQALGLKNFTWVCRRRPTLEECAKHWIQEISWACMAKCKHSKTQRRRRNDYRELHKPKQPKENQSAFLNLLLLKHHSPSPRRHMQENKEGTGSTGRKPVCATEVVSWGIKTPLTTCVTHSINVSR